MNSIHNVGLFAVVWLLACHCIAGETATAVATIAAGYVSAITVTSGGSGYTSDPAVTLNGGGGSGATAKAVLQGDRVSLIIVLTAGNGYTSLPIVTIEPPPKPIAGRLELVPRLTVRGQPKSLAILQWAESEQGPWNDWTNIVVNPEGTVLVDLEPGTRHRFYRAVESLQRSGPQGFVWIAPGTLEISGQLQRTLSLKRGLWFSDHEVTQAEYQLVMGSNPSVFNWNPNHPVEQVNWFDAVEYCSRLTDIERAAGRISSKQVYRLPTADEWEYAARANTTGPRYGELSMIAWWSSNSGKQTHPVKQKAPNAWGLYDMIGNVWEWCGDNLGSYRVLCGGSWALRVDIHGNLEYAGSASRWTDDPNLRNWTIGFRTTLDSVQ